MPKTDAWITPGSPTTWAAQHLVHAPMFSGPVEVAEPVDMQRLSSGSIADLASAFAMPSTGEKAHRLSGLLEQDGRRSFSTRSFVSLLRFVRDQDLAEPDELSSIKGEIAGEWHGDVTAIARFSEDDTVEFAALMAGISLHSDGPTERESIAASVFARALPKKGDSRSHA